MTLDPHRSVLRRFATGGLPTRDSFQERCELCGDAIEPQHRHLIDIDSRDLNCACRACTILFDREGAGAGRYRLIADRVLRVVDFHLDDLGWASLRIPVQLAFFTYDSSMQRVRAYYPSPLGATEAQLHLDRWEAIRHDNPVVASIEPDVEALLVHRRERDPRYLVVPIDKCYSLVGVIRTHWKGLSGGTEVWDEVDRFFDDLSSSAATVDRDGNGSVASGKEEAWAG